MPVAVVEPSTAVANAAGGSAAQMVVADRNQGFVQHVLQFKAPFHRIGVDIGLHAHHAAGSVPTGGVEIVNAALAQIARAVGVYRAGQGGLHDGDYGVHFPKIASLTICLALLLFSSNAFSRNGFAVEPLVVCHSPRSS